MTANNLGKHARLHSLNWISHSYNAAATANLLYLSLPMVSGRKIIKHLNQCTKALKHVESVSLKVDLK